MNENYSWRKRYQRGYGEESASPALKKVLDSRKKRPYVMAEKDHEGHEYTIDKEREELEKDIPPAPVPHEEEPVNENEDRITPEDRAIIEKLSTPPVTVEDRAIVERSYQDYANTILKGSQ